MVASKPINKKTLWSTIHVEEWASWNNGKQIPWRCEYKFIPTVNWEKMPSRDLGHGWHTERPRPWANAHNGIEIVKCTVDGVEIPLAGQKVDCEPSIGLLINKHMGFDGVDPNHKKVWIDDNGFWGNNDM